MSNCRPPRAIAPALATLIALGLAAPLHAGGDPVFDCNGNGIEDADDIVAGTSQDGDGNGVPDECDPIGATILCVDQSAIGDGSGANWINAYPELRDALSAAAGDPTITEIWIARTVDPANPHLPTDGGDRTISFALTSGLALYGGFVGYTNGDVTPGPENYEQSVADRNVANPANETILSGDIGIPGLVADNSHRVLSAVNLADAVRLDGLTIAHGVADALTFDRGAGVFLVGSTLQMESCVVRDHIASAGAGIYADAGSSVAIGPAPGLAGGGLVRTRFEDNVAVNGAGVYLTGDPSSISQADFLGNTARFGAGLYLISADADLADCHFENNMGSIDPLGTGVPADTTWGGALYANMANLAIADSTFLNNSVNAEFAGAGASVFGGAIYATLANLDIDDTDFEGNAATVTNGARGSTDVGGGAITLQIGTLDCDAATTFLGNLISAGDEVEGDAVGGGVATASAQVILNGTRFQLNQILSAGSALASGAGLYVQDDEPGSVISGCVFADNVSAGDGGGMTLFGTSDELAITGGTFSANAAATFGGGIARDGASGDVLDCLFIQNSAFRGGAISNFNAASGLVSGCEFNANTAANDGGAIDVRQASSISVHHGMFIDNTADEDGGALRNAGVGTAGTYVNCVFTGNRALGLGGVEGRGGVLLNANGATTTMINCTLNRNCSESGGGGGAFANRSGATVIMANCILWGNNNLNQCGIPGNEDDEFFIDGGAITDIRHSVVDDGGFGGPGRNNITSNPRFVNPNDPLNGGLALQDISPALDAGDNTRVPAEIVTDIDGNDRFLDDPAADCAQADDIADCGVAPIVDMGAYERVPEFVCLGDSDGDGSIGTPDLLGMLGAWFSADPVFDLDGSGDVGVPDLLLLLAAWGGCVEP